jgi:hypothetical protein
MAMTVSRCRCLGAALIAACIFRTLELAAQDSHIRLPAADVERLMREGPITPLAGEGSRFEGDRTQHVLVRFAADTAFEVKWAEAPPGGQTFNNQPRYEVAAYELQKLFLDEPDYVVPPTVLRMVPLSQYRQRAPAADPTWKDASSVLGVLQYWTEGVTGKDVFDERRAERDSVYARHLGDLNILTYLIRHGDSNDGNVVISSDSASPRLFAVDNGVAFASPPSDRGTKWREIRVKRLPGRTVERLRKIDQELLVRALGVLAQYELRTGEYAATPPSENVNARNGVRRSGSVLQLGLTSAEINDVRERLESLLKAVDKGKLKTF